MDVFIRIARLGKAVALPDLHRQQIGQLLSARVQSPAHRVPDRALVQRRVHPVDRQDAARHTSGFVVFFIGGVDHAETAAAALDLSVKAHAVTAREIIFYIILVKICYVNRSALIHRPKLHQLHTAPYTDKARHVRDQGADAHALPLRCRCDGAEFCPILIARGKIGHKIIERKDAEFFERLRLFLPYSFEILYG